MNTAVSTAVGAAVTGHVTTSGGTTRTRWWRRPGVRVFAVVYLIAAALLTSNVVRETYLALAVAERGTVRVDDYVELHPDLFSIVGRGSYINSNPGASFLGAVPLVMARPGLAALYAVKPALRAPKPPTAYDDPRPNRTRFMNAMRAKGLDVHLALAAFITQLGLMAPLTALSAVLVMRWMTAVLGDVQRAERLALLYALATPILFRTAFLNQNLLLTHAMLAMWLLLVWPGQSPRAPGRDRRWMLVGALLGLGMLLDYSAAPLAIAFGVWALVDGWQAGGVRSAFTRGALTVAGSVPGVLALLGYQQVAFGSPWFPAQRYMPPTEYSVIGWNGMTLPTLDLLWQNTFGTAFGLFAFCPFLLLAVYGSWKRAAWVSRSTLWAIWGVSFALWLFNSANRFSYMQFNTGVRYMVPLVPLLFTLCVSAFRDAPRWIVRVLVGASVLISAAVSMTRENVVEALTLTAQQGPTLPMLLVLRKTAAAYAPWLTGAGVQPLGAITVLGVLLVAWGVWRLGAPGTAEPTAS